MKHKESCGPRMEGNELFRVFLGFSDKLSSLAPHLWTSPPQRRPVPVPVIPETAAAALAGVSLRLKREKTQAW